MNLRLLASAAVLLLGCSSPTAPVWPGVAPPAHCKSTAGLAHSIYLIGDAGAPELAGDGSDTLVDPVLLSLQRDVEEIAAALGPDAASVIYLGDNVYQRGLVPEGHEDRRQGERILEAQIAASGPGRAYFLAGNHDWDIEGDNGWQHILAQREFLEARGPRVEMLPRGGCLGPRQVDFGDHLRFVFFDPVAIWHARDFPEEHALGCPNETDLVEQYLELARAFDETDGRHIALAVHHPLVTAGPHGGHYTWKQHIFPLTDFVPWLWIPLPIIGSVYPLSRQLGVTRVDATSEPYVVFVNAIYQAWTLRGPMLVAAGHEHSLQVHRDVLGMFYAVSGAGSASKVNRVEPMETVLMSAAKPGYMRLDALADGSLALDVLAVQPDAGSDAAPETIYSACLADGPAGRVKRMR